ncbi:hypothetical protein WKR88_05185 [Trinickia caryophylli]|uniref:Uncharacterized protein n=1 Tax=Trinickia caryophylli TaxID=28094 RepID=A0A1X7FJW4_TRICW|nr:hypothetical protein [Trinickia caryophylli]WQE13395.1 hypothetical protein U0034_08530 [Trinickia caryophylli]GLU34086.1 hypothetical protein Busp01_39280 [Trinickia caryophylli]SMF53476.1 hypothetical protein SAMN06295900_109126 [Trinickia caryophylli]
MSDADDAAVLATLARLRRVREMRAQIARVAAARQQSIAAQSRRALDQAVAHLNAQAQIKAAIQQRLAAAGGSGADAANSARALQEAAADTRTVNMRIGTATRSVTEASQRHDSHEAQLAQLQRAARRAKAAEDKLEKAGEKAQRARAARLERAADEVADSHAVRRFAELAGAGGADGAAREAEGGHEAWPAFHPDSRC